MITPIVDNSQKSSTDDYKDWPTTLNDIWSDEQYLSMIERYKDDPKRYQLLLQNPFMRSRAASFVPSFWQQVFGSDRAERDYYSDMRNNAVDWLGKHAEGFYEEDYNNPVSQVNRQAAAGINPDLSPGSISPGTAAENDQHVTKPLSTGGESSLSEFLGPTVQFMNFILSGAKSFQDLRSGSLNNVMSELSTNDAARDYMIRSLGLTSTFAGWSDEDWDDPDKFANVIQAAVKEAEFPGYSKDTQKFLKRFSENISHNPKSLLAEDFKWQLRESIANHKSNVQNILRRPDYDDNFQNWIDKGVKLFSDIEYQTWKLQQRAQQKDADASIISSELQKIRDSAMKKLYSWVQGDENNPQWYNTLGTIGLPILLEALSSLGSGFGKLIPFATKVIK